MALLSASTVATRAQTNWTGTTSNDWFTATNWSAGVPTLGTAATINTTSPNATVVGAPGAVAQTLSFGQFFGVGNLTIQNGGTLLTSAGGVIGGLGRGDVTVTGPGSQWTNVNGGIQVGTGSGVGTLTVANGGLVNDTPSGTSVGGRITVGGGGDLFSGALIGNGTVSSTLTQINAGGFLVPGQGIVPGQGGTPDAMRFIGNLAFQSGAFYVVQVNPTTASTSNVLGTATLNGGTVVANFAPGSYVSRFYPILTAVASERH